MIKGSVGYMYLLYLVFRALDVCNDKRTQIRTQGVVVCVVNTTNLVQYLQERHWVVFFERFFGELYEPQ